ncbi:MAG: hypothetical protein RL136_1009 [Planctomycetota bacterium]|jgi:hypothetical protein
MGRFTLARLSLLALAVVAPLVGCQPGLTQPVVLKAPYSVERAWAVVPFANESGVTGVDGADIADRFVSEIEQVDGLRCLPLNRTLAAMKSLGMTGVRDLQQASTLIRTLQVDGLVLGTVTEWDAYKPLRFGAAVEVIAASEGADRRPLDLKELTMPTAEGTGGAAAVKFDAEVSQASRVFDARNHETLADLERYARGRFDPKSPLGVQAYETRMDLFTRYGAFALTRDLLEQEAARLGAALPGGRAERPQEN